MPVPDLLNMSDRRISEEQAQRIWRRAAELQATAAERAELRKRNALARPDDPATDDLSLSDVEAAAVEAGIGSEFVHAAIAEVEGESAVQPNPGGWVSRTTARLLGQPPRILETSRVIAASPEEVYSSMQRIFPNPPFGLILRDTMGADLFTDGVLVFETEYAHARTSFEWQMEFGDVKRILVTMRRVPGRQDATEVTARAPLGRLGLNLTLCGGFTGAGGSGGAIAGAAVAPELIGALGAGGILASAVVAASAVITGVAAGGLVLAGYRALYRWGMRHGLTGIESLLQALAVDIRTHGAFAPRVLQPPGPGALPGSQS